MDEMRKWKSERELLLDDEFAGRFSLGCAAAADNALAVWIPPGTDHQAVVIHQVVAKAAYSGAGALTIEAAGEVVWEQDLAASGSEKEFDFGALGVAGPVGAGVWVRARAAKLSGGRLWVLGQRR